LKHSYNKEGRNMCGNLSGNPSLKGRGAVGREKKEKI
jgi:hypothetical protein